MNITILIISASVIFAHSVYGDDSIPIAESRKQQVSFDQYMQAIVDRIEGTPSFTSNLNSTLEVEGHLVFYMPAINLEQDLARFNEFVENAIWESPNGPIYSFSKCTMTFPTGKGELADSIAVLVGGISLRFAPATLSGGMCSSIFTQSL